VTGIIAENVDEDISRLTEIRDSLAKPHKDKLAEIEAKVHIPMLELKKTFVSQYGKINFRKGATRRIWNLDALDVICNANPKIKETIWMFREEKTGEPSISLKLE